MFLSQGSDELGYLPTTSLQSLAATAPEGMASQQCPEKAVLGVGGEVKWSAPKWEMLKSDTELN